MFKVIKLKPILMCISIILASVLLSVGIVGVVNMDAVPKTSYVIVLDA